MGISNNLSQEDFKHTESLILILKSGVNVHSMEYD